MTTDIRFSVLMTARNSQKTIDLAIKSTLAGMSDADELIVLLDAPTDGTETVVKMIRDPRLSVHVSSSNIGINKSRNHLLEMASKPYVGVIDADDVSMPWRFYYSRKLIRLGYDIVFGTAIVFGKQLRPLPVMPQYPISLGMETAGLALLAANPFVHSSMSASKSMLIEAGGYSDSLSEDYDLWLRLTARGSRMFRTRVPLVGYRFHQSQASQHDDFMQRVWANKSLQSSYKLAAEKVLNKASSSESEVDRERITQLARQELYKLKPSMKLEHQGLPEFMKRWKNKKKEL